MLLKLIHSFGRFFSASFFAVLLSAAYVWVSVPTSSATAETPIHVATIETMHGKGWGQTGVGTKYKKVQGDQVIKDEVISTGYKSAMTMRFIDNTTMKLGHDAQIQIDDMVYDPANSEKDTVVIRLGVGAFYFVSGKVAKEKVFLITATTTIGIRGTALLIDVQADGTTTVGVAKGRAFMHSRRNNSRTEIALGSTGSSDARGNVSESHKGLDLTGDEDINRNIGGFSDWLDEKAPKKSQDFNNFSTEAPEGGGLQSGANNDGADQPDGELSRDQGDHVSGMDGEGGGSGDGGSGGGSDGGSGGGSDGGSGGGSDGGSGGGDGGGDGGGSNSGGGGDGGDGGGDS